MSLRPFISASSLRPLFTSSCRTAASRITVRYTPAQAQVFSQHYLTRTMATSTSSSPTVTDALLKDHREIESYYNEVVNSNDPDHQERFGNQFTWELARHSVAEELIIYPAFEKYLGAKGKQMAESDRKQHHEVKEALKKFQNLKPKDAEFIPTLKSLMTTLSQHIKEEETEDIPALEQALSGDHNNTGVSESLATKFGRTKAFVPSRSHPSAGEHPPFETVMGLLTAPIDHIADIFRKFPDKTISPNPSTK